MEYSEEIKISSAAAYCIEQLFREQPVTESECFGEDEKYSVRATFSNGYSMCIELCGVQYDENSDNTPYSQAVLYDEKGNQIAYSEPDWEFFGEWSFDYEGATYTVRVNVDSNENPAESEHFAEMEDVFEDGLRKMGYLHD